MPNLRQSTSINAMNYFDEPSWIATYLSELERHGMTAGAARAAGVTSRHVEKYAGEHPDFEQARIEALELFADILEQEAVRRATEGVEKGVYFKGELKDTEQVYSDGLLTTLLKGRRGHMYGDKKEVNFRGDLQIVLAGTAQPLEPGQSRVLQAQRAANRPLPHPTQTQIIQQRVAELLGEPTTLVAEDFL